MAPRSAGRRKKKGGQEYWAEDDEDTEYDLTSLRGSWLDTKGSMYDVDIWEDGRVDVLTTRPNQETILSSDLIRFDPKSDWIVWGRSGERSQYWLSELTGDFLRWEREGSKAFEWTRNEYETRAWAERFRIARVAKEAEKMWKDGQTYGDARHQSKYNDYLEDTDVGDESYSDDYSAEKFTQRGRGGKGKTTSKEKAKYTLSSLCGTWYDTNGSTYDVDLNNGNVVELCTTKPSGEVIVNQSLISWDDEKEWIVWGRGKTPQYWLTALGPKKLLWESDSPKRKPFEWTRQVPPAVPPAVSPPAVLPAVPVNVSNDTVWKAKDPVKEQVKERRSKEDCDEAGELLLKAVRAGREKPPDLVQDVEVPTPLDAGSDQRCDNRANIAAAAAAAAAMSAGNGAYSTWWPNVTMPGVQQQLIPPFAQPHSPPQHDFFILRQQLEYYFSDENLDKSSHMKGLMEVDGWVNLEEVNRFNRMRSYDKWALVQAILISSELELHGTTSHVRIRDVARRNKWRQWADCQ